MVVCLHFFCHRIFRSELLLVQSGGIFEATSFAKPCEVSRATIQNYLAVLEATFVATVVRPYHSNKAVEIIAAPKVYGFDTGFVCAFRGWNELRQDDFGVLWEHYVLNEINSLLPGVKLQYWRDKQKHRSTLCWHRGPTLRQWPSSVSGRRMRLTPPTRAR